MKFFRSRLTVLFAAIMLVAASVSGFTGCNFGTAPTVKEEKPGAVKNLRARAGDEKITLIWENPKAAGFQSVKVFIGDKEEAELKNKETSYEFTGLTNGTEYCFKVVAYFENEEAFESPFIKATPKDVTNLSSVEFAKKLVIGWNLGNTMDANSETGWGMPMTTEAMIKAVHAAGFETIRIPVSWHYHVSGTDNKINSTWMARVKTIVDWAINDGMYVIINIHHDNLAEGATGPGFILSKKTDVQDKSKKFITDVWSQVATTFAAYDEHLVYEILNEPRDIDGKVWGNEWWCGGSSGIEVCKVITDYEQAALDVIRSIPGNEDRFVMVPGYAASASDISMLNCYEMPKDTAEDKLLLSGHAYTPYPFAMKDMVDTVFGSDDKKTLDDMFAKLNTKYISKGIGIVMGEASASDKDNLEERIKWAEYYFGSAKKYGIPVVLWDNMVLYKNSKDPAESHGYFDRRNLKWYFPDLIETMVTAAGGNASGEGNQTPEAPEDPAAPFTAVTLFDAENSTAPDGMEIVTLDGKKYLKLTINGYSTSFTIPAVDCNGATSFKVECRADETTSDYQVIIGIKDSSFGDISTPVMNPLKKEASVLTGSASSGDKASTTKIASIIQPMAQNTTDWGAANGIVFYISKITAE